MEHKITIRKYRVNRVSFLMRTGKLKRYTMNQLHEAYGQYVVAIDDTIYMDDNLPEKFDVISNDMELPLMGLTGVKTISLYYPKEIPEGHMPEFGFTFCNNVSMHQFNMDAETFFNDVKVKPFYFWGFDKKLYINRWSYFRTEVQWYIDRVAELGYWAPITLYIDKNIELYNFAIMVYVSKLLNIETIPVRLLTYVDYKYIEILQPNLYAKIQELPENPYYTKKDETDILPIILTKVSEKKKVLKEMRTIFPNLIGNVIDFPLANYNEIPFFIFDSSHNNKNWELINTIASKNYPEVTLFKDDNDYEGPSMCAELFWRLHGKIPYVQKNKTIEIKNYAKTDYEVDSIKEVTDFTLFPIETISYWKDAIDKENDFTQYFDTDFCIIDDDKTFLIGIENIHNILNKDSIKIAYLKHK